EVVQPVGRLLACPRRDVRGHRHGLGAVVRRPHRRQTPGPVEPHHPPAHPGAVRTPEARAHHAAEAPEGRRLPRTRSSNSVHSDAVLSAKSDAPPAVGSPDVPATTIERSPADVLRLAVAAAAVLILLAVEWLFGDTLVSF